MVKILLGHFRFLRNHGNILRQGKNYFALFSVILLFIYGCKKPEDIGLDVLPGDDLLYTHYSDAALVHISVSKEDSLRADELSRMLFGSIKEDTFGLVNSSWFGQVLLSSTPNFDTSLYTPDSVVLSLGFAGWYGDTNTQQQVHVYRMLEDMYVDSSYYSDRTFLSDLTDLAYYPSTPRSFTPTTPVVLHDDSVGASDDTVSAHLRIRLTDALRDTLFYLNGQAPYTSNDTWRSYFKGLQIKVDPVVNGGAVYYFAPTSSFSRLILYYHHDTSNVTQSYSYSFTNGARVNHIEHDFTGSVVSDSASHPELGFIQSLGGVKTLVSFPDLKHFTDSGSILLNRAELVIPTLSGTSTLYPPPADLLLALMKESGELAFPIDYYESGFGGSYNSVTNSYTFAVTRQLQAILNGTSQDTLFSISVLGSMVQANRVIVGSGVNTTSPMKLKLYYTKLP